ncbi:hypothetical protein [Frankia sp. R82]|uniref:hypothetical protein n=1 Tax=Frankia sp. R82 TaxID=2950553 RepID=UPI002044CDFC|nr:hypothetical protein [Frankia sp. R82]MCM3885047.1 hypothetical protein [Frankia sp. R82]
MLQRLVTRSSRHTGVQFPIGFVRDPSTGAPPLSRLIRGGRGGEVRLKLYLCLTLVAVQRPYSIRDISTRAWARALALPEPPTNGARRIGDALDWLRDEKLVELTRHRGGAPTVKLLSPMGDGKEYSWRGSGRYVRMPLGFWSEEWITKLSATAIALLLVVLEMQGGRNPDNPPWIAGPDKGRYGLSDDTWTRARQELEAAGLLTVERAMHGQDFDVMKLRNTYWIDVDRLDYPEGKPPQPPPPPPREPPRSPRTAPGFSPEVMALLQNLARPAAAARPPTSSASNAQQNAMDHHGNTQPS